MKSSFAPNCLEVVYPFQSKEILPGGLANSLLRVGGFSMMAQEFGKYILPEACWHQLTFGIIPHNPKRNGLKAEELGRFVSSDAERSGCTNTFILWLKFWICSGYLLVPCILLSFLIFWIIMESCNQEKMIIVEKERERKHTKTCFMWEIQTGKWGVLAKVFRSDQLVRVVA